MRVIETFMFRDELDMLEMKLSEHDPFVDQWIIIESPVTHRGEPKPLFLKDNARRFAPWASKITHVVADLPSASNPWVREHAQRDAAIPVLEQLGLADHDVVVLADLDEFLPRGFDFTTVAPHVTFHMQLLMYAVDWQHPEAHDCTVAVRWAWARTKSLATIRDNRRDYRHVNGGQHITWLGWPEDQHRKLAVHCHMEMLTEEHDRIYSGACYLQGIHHTGSMMMIPVDVDETWPERIFKRDCPDNWFRPRQG